MITAVHPDLPAIGRRPVPTKSQLRFTLDGSEELENQLTRICHRVLAGVQHVIPSAKLEGLLLGGGYGRGQGGVLKSETGDQPYNDLEFYVCLRGNRFINEHLYRVPLHELGESLSASAGVETEFKIISFAHLRHSAPTMFYYDLIMGHRWLWGDEQLLKGCEHHRDASLIPMHEATRLLMNRCSGLLFAREKLGHVPFTAEDADFVGRNLAKAQLAFGDAILTAFGQYHWSCLERNARLQRLQPTESLPSFPGVLCQHAAGMKFKLRPHHSRLPASTLKISHQKLTTLGLQVWLWLENRRLGRHFQSACDYALNPADKCSETNAWRNVAVNAKLFGPAAALRSHFTRHPREKVLNVLAMLLWETSIPNSELQNWAREELVYSSGDSTNLTDAYRTLWRHVN